LSLMDALVEEGYAVYAIDLRGYGATPRDSTQWFTPDKAAKDLKAVLEWINDQKEWKAKPHLFGWSMGSSNSQLTAQRYPQLISSLILFGYWVDADTTFPVDNEGIKPEYIVNTAEAAASDFLNPGVTISQKAIDRYVEEALKADSIKVDWKNLSDYNELDPALVTVPTLLIQGIDDPIAPTERQVKLYTRLGSTYKEWVTLEGDHAAFMETAKESFVKSMTDFMRLVSAG
ncbi:MAG: alpha/beta fold hydrolase, partial [Bacteroidota bacterium]